MYLQRSNNFLPSAPELAEGHGKSPAGSCPLSPVFLAFWPATPRPQPFFCPPPLLSFVLPPGPALTIHPRDLDGQSLHRSTSFRAQLTGNCIGQTCSVHNDLPASSTTPSERMAPYHDSGGKLAAVQGGCEARRSSAGTEFPLNLHRDLVQPLLGPILYLMAPNVYLLSLSGS